MPEANGYLEGIGGLRLFYRAHEVEGAIGRLLLLHGLGEHSGRYGHVAARANEAGFGCYALDLRGHGRSQGSRGHVRTFDCFLQDVDRLRRRTAQGGPPKPTFVFGHSLGGLIAGRYIQEFSFPGLRGAALVAPFVQLTMEIPKWKSKLGGVADRLLPSLALDNGLREEELFREESERVAYREDPLVHRRVSARLWGEMLRNARLLEDRADQVRLPVLFQLPEEDRIVSSGTSRSVAGRMAGEVQVYEYVGAYHALYHDPEREKSLSDLTAWLNSRTESEGVEPTGGRVVS